MLNIINNLRPFIEDCYRRINVREYARLTKISPPTASKILSEFNQEGLLSIEKDRNYIFCYLCNYGMFWNIFVYACFAIILQSPLPIVSVVDGIEPWCRNHY